MIDIILNNDRNIQIEDGDFSIGESTDQNVELLFISNPGEWKEHIEAGIAIERSYNGSIDRFIDRTIRVQTQADGYKIAQLKISATGIIINGSYE